MGFPLMPETVATLVPDPKAERRRLMKGLKDGDTTFSLWYDNWNDRQYAYVPVNTSSHQADFTILCAFPAWKRDYPKSKSLEYLPRDPPVPLAGLIVHGVEKMCGYMEKLSGKEGKWVKPAGYWADIPFHKFNLGLEKNQTDWETTLPVLPTSRHDTITCQPTKHWHPLEVYPEPAGSVAGRWRGLQWVEWYAKEFWKCGYVLPVTLDYDTWYNLLKARLDKDKRGVGLYNVLPLLDIWHILKYTTRSFMELFASLMPSLNQHLFKDGDKPLRMTKVAQQQWFLCVLALAYQNQTVSFCEWEIGSDTHNETKEFVDYLAAVFDCALPLCWGAWWLYREGRTADLLKTLCMLLPLLHYCKHPNYVFGTAYHCSLLLGNSGGALQWMKDGMFRLSCAETGELAFKFVSDRLRSTNIYSDQAAVERGMFGLPVFWQAQQHCNSLFLQHAKKVYRAQVAYDGKWVIRVQGWISMVVSKLESEQVLGNAWPHGGSFLQPQLKRGISAYLDERVATLVKEEPAYLKGRHSYGAERVRAEAEKMNEDDVWPTTVVWSIQSNSTDWQKWLQTNYHGDIPKKEWWVGYVPFQKSTVGWHISGGVDWVEADDYQVEAPDEVAVAEEEEEEGSEGSQVCKGKRKWAVDLQSDSASDNETFGAKMEKNSKKAT